MKNVIMLVLLTLISSFSTVVAEELEFSWESARGFEENIFNSTNAHSMFKLTFKGTSFFTNKIGHGFLRRTTEVVTISAMSVAYTMSKHENAHAFVLEENGANAIDVRYDWLNWSVHWEGDLSRQEDVMVTSAGMTWSNHSSGLTVARNIGEKVSVSELLWFSINNVDTPRYILSHTGNYPCSGNCSDDVNIWYRLLGDSIPYKTEKLRDDLRIGAYWQALGEAIPIYAILKYLKDGKEYTMPNVWVNPQVELTDAGVMYTLDVWYKTNKDLLLRFREGYGKNRVEGGDMYSFEVEVSRIPLFAKLKGGVRGGFSKTLEDSYFYGFSLERPITERISLAFRVNHYDGYHRLSPKAEGKSWNEVILGLKFSL